MKALVCGSRKFKDKQYVYEVLKAFDVELIISGGAKEGPDNYAVFYAHENNIPFKVVQAKWRNNGILDRSAGIKRNHIMVDMLEPDDIVIAFWDQKSTGTKDTIDYARKKNIKVYLYYERDQS